MGYLLQLEKVQIERMLARSVAVDSGAAECIFRSLPVGIAFNYGRASIRMSNFAISFSFVSTYIHS